MKRTVKYALSAALSVAIVAPAFAQDNFPDVPANHWAFEALARLKKDGILVGYPDNLYRGGRPASRYELAAAVHAAYVNLKNQSDGLAAQIAALEDKVNGGGGVTKADIDNLKAALAAAQSDIDSMKGWGDDIANLKKMATEFSKELQSMGVDVEAIKSTLTDIGNRVTALEKRKPAVDISGDADWLVLGASSASHTYGIGVDGRAWGVGRGSFGGSPPATVGMDRDATVLHEIAATVSGTNDTGPKWHGTVVMGNFLGFDSNFDGEPFPTQSDLEPGEPFSEGVESIYLQDFVVDWDTSIGGIALDTEAGRIGMKVSPLIFQRPAVLAYSDNERWNNGLWYFDGANVGVKAGPAKLHIFAGRDNPSEYGSTASTDGFSMMDMEAGQNGIPFTPGQNRPVGLNRDANTNGGFENTNLLDIDQHLGVTADLPLGANGNVDLAYLWLGSDFKEAGVGPNSGIADSVHVYGGTVTFNTGPLNLWGTYSKSDVYGNNTALVTKQDDAWMAGVGHEAAKWGGKVDYRQINPQFGAPGAWGRIGDWWNPRDIKGVAANLHFDLAETLQLILDGQFYTGTGNSVNVDGDSASGLSTDDKIQSIKATLAHKISAMNSVELGYEDVRWSLADRPAASFTGGKPVEKWYTLGFRHKISEGSSFHVQWQVSDYDGKGVQGFNPFNNGIASSAGFGTAKGSLLTTELDVKFG